MLGRNNDNDTTDQGFDAEICKLIDDATSMVEALTVMVAMNATWWSDEVCRVLNQDWPVLLQGHQPEGCKGYSRVLGQHKSYPEGR